MASFLTFVLSLAERLGNAVFEPLIIAPFYFTSLYFQQFYLAQKLIYNIETSVLGMLFGLGLIRKINSFLSDRMLNNWNSDAYDWTKEVVVITGGSSGIGELVTQDLCRRGISVAIVDIVKPKYKIGKTAQFFQCDLSKHAEIADICAQIRNTMGHPTILLNNAGIASGKPLLETDDKEYQAMFDINTIAHFHLVKNFLPNMIQHNHGHIITIASMASFVTIPLNVSYSQAKASAHAFHEGLSQEIKHIYGAPKVRTSIFHPSWVETPMTRFLTTAKGWDQPTLKASEVADSIVKCILEGRSRRVFLPGGYVWAATIKGWPSWVQEGVRNRGAGMVRALQGGGYAGGEE
ncbi:Short-chain dehydrogenase reductase SDR protein [Rutstroemia sp. NJR-2017a BBW]|nr:Short-chain dehydrogenase reductase SDR protein [Rutstroemia sp. NJR-2017a BBW]